MANLRECKVCREEQERKHRFDGVWRVIAVLSTIVAIVFVCLYFTSGDVVKKTTINNEVEITNMGGDAKNENIANINSENGISTTAIIVFAVIGALLIFGGVYCAHIISSRNNQQSGSYHKQGDADGDKKG